MKHQNIFEELQYAKKSVQNCLENEAVMVDFHGLSYWAGEVERLREVIKKSL